MWEIDSIADSIICKRSIRQKNMLMVNTVHLWFLTFCIARGKRNKSDVLTGEIAPHSGKFASFRRQARSNAPLFPEYGDARLSSFHWLVHKTHVQSQRSAAAKWETHWPVISEFSTFLKLTNLENNFLRLTLFTLFKVNGQSFSLFTAID